MAPNSLIPMNIIGLALVAGTILGCQASTQLNSCNTFSKIQSRTHIVAKKYYQISCTQSIQGHVGMQVRGGASDGRRSYDRPEYDDRSRRRPQYDDRGEQQGRDAIRSPRDFEDNSRHASMGERKMRRDDRWRNESRGKRPDYNSRPERSARNRVDSPPDKEKKGWFSSTKRQLNDVKEYSISEKPQQPPPPPPPPPNTFVDYNPAESERVPINYMFPTTEVAAAERSRDERTSNIDPMGGPDFPVEEMEDRYAGSGERRERRRRRENDDESYASPRRDAVTVYMSSRLGAAKVRCGSIVVGAALGSFIGKSLMNDALKMSVILAGVLFFAGFLRNDYGELSRALGLAFLMTIQRTGSVRRQYPTMVHLKAMIRQGPRKPFPPIEDGSSPWRYEPIYEDDPEFKMTYALLAMALVGSFCGGNVPLLPQWMGGIIGSILFASFTSGSNARGDLGRTMGMRVVGLLQLVLKINTELRILGKAATVGGLIFDKLMIMDRKHRIKDKIVAICKWGYDKVSNTAAEMQADMKDDRERD